MRRSVSWRLHLKSENKFRTIDPRAAMANMATTKKVRNDVALVLSCLPKPKAYLAAPGPGMPPPANVITVTMWRISPGRLDKDNLHGSLKAVRDGVADWLGLKGHDVDSSRLVWIYDQAPCPLKDFGVRIDIEDLADGEDVQRILSNAPSRVGIPGEGRRTVPAAPPKVQQTLFSRPCFALLPWNEEGVVSKLAIEGEPPEIVRVPVPARALTSSMCRLRPGTLVELFRSESTMAIFDEDAEEAEEAEEAADPIWLYQAKDSNR